jgi:pentose-5-phosphate-3-epimerase
LEFLIQIDGGVDANNVAEVVRAGVDVVVSGSGLFRKDLSLQKSVEAMRAAIRQAF